MRTVYWIADNITSPIAGTAAANFDGLTRSETGIRLQDRKSWLETSFYASLFPETFFKQDKDQTAFEQLLIHSVTDALAQTQLDAKSEKTILIVSSTKGNIGLLEKEVFSEELQEKISLTHSADVIKNHFGLANEPLIISHACISGVLALITGMRLLEQGVYDQAIVAGADLITQFILTGFNSFQAISDEPCKPFDANRKGVTLGEGAATAILSVTPGSGSSVRLTGGAVSNDANHISGPSRTGAELAQAIQHALAQAALSAADIDMISAHGTATLYNDDMESKAFQLCGLQQTPVNSLKGYYGHTLGAAGLIESVIVSHSLRQNKIIATKGCDTPGTAAPLQVCLELTNAPLQVALKTGSGFGGCNAALILQRN